MALGWDSLKSPGNGDPKYKISNPGDEDNLGVFIPGDREFSFSEIEDF